MKTTNKCDPDYWLPDTHRDCPPWRSIEEDARLGDETAAILLAMRSLLETYKVAGLDLYNQIDSINARIDRVQFHDQP